MFEPKRLKKADFDRIQKALIRFYSGRPEEYGLLERPQEAYDDYCALISEFCRIESASILDVGSGSWRIPETIAAKGYRKVTGLDYFDDDILQNYKNQIKSKNVELVRYEEPNKFPFPDSSFDVVTSLCVIEHLIYPELILNEMNRVLKPGGIFVISCPNWSGINVPIMGLLNILKTKDRFWRFNNLSDSFFGIFRSVYWWLEASLSREPKFILIYPRMKGSEIDFERSDDDAVHLCQPKSFKKFFNQRGYSLLMYNRGSGSTNYSKIFNKFFPSMATTNTIVTRKNK